MTAAKAKSISNLFNAAPPPPLPQGLEDKAKDTNTTRMMNFRINDDARQAFAFLALEERSSIQKLMIEAVNDLFKKYSKPPIA